MAFSKASEAVLGQGFMSPNVALTHMLGTMSHQQGIADLVAQDAIQKRRAQEAANRQAFAGKLEAMQQGWNPLNEIGPSTVRMMQNIQRYGVTGR
jgi:hypothetical protein